MLETMTRLAVPDKQRVRPRSRAKAESVQPIVIVIGIFDGECPVCTDKKPTTATITNGFADFAGAVHPATQGGVRPVILWYNSSPGVRLDLALKATLR